jgi:imidazolonepropionase
MSPDRTTILKPKADLLVKNCKQLLTLHSSESEPRRGASLANLAIVEGGAFASAAGRIVTTGSQPEVEAAIEPTPDCAEIDAGAAVVMPGFVDSHTHTCFADYRLDEYEQRVRGVPYAQIAAEGGGIAKSVADVRKMGEETLREVTARRLQGCIRHGATTIEIKSGYGLDLDNEMKQLRVIRTVSEQSPALVVPTFLGAHALPPEFSGRREDFIDLVVHEMVPAVVTEGLAEFIDVFSEIGVFTTPEAERILRAGQQAGLKARVHADELSDTGSGEMAARIGAVSADHLTRISKRGIAAMAKSAVIGVLLPGTSFGLPSLHFAPAREMIERGMAIALATDFNPGSSPSESMPMMISIATSHMRLSPAEAIAAATYNAAFAICRHNEVGSLDVGKRTDFLILDCDDYREIPYRFGTNPVSRVFIEGREWTGA